MFRIRSAVPALGVLAFTLVASAGSLNTVVGPSITFASEGKGVTVISIEGKVIALSATDDGTNLVLKTDATHVRTGNDTRDGHIVNEWIKSHPITLTVAKSALKIPTDAPTSGIVSGDLVVNNVKSEKPVKVNYTAKNAEGGGYAVTGNFKFDLANHLAEKKPPKYLGITADTLVTVKASFTIKEK